MKKEELMKQYEELKGKGKEPEMIFLYIHMPTGETETIVNPNVEEKLKYIDRTYNEDLVHANCKDIYIEQACICADFGPTMMFSDAYMLMKQGAKSYKSVWKVLQTATSVQEASDIFLVKFEAPTNTGSAVKKTRASYGEQYLKIYQNQKKEENKVSKIENAVARAEAIEMEISIIRAKRRKIQKITMREKK